MIYESFYIQTEGGCLGPWDFWLPSNRWELRDSVAPVETYKIPSQHHFDYGLRYAKTLGYNWVNNTPFIMKRNPVENLHSPPLNLRHDVTPSYSVQPNQPTSSTNRRSAEDGSLVTSLRVRQAGRSSKGDRNGVRKDWREGIPVIFC